MAKTWDVAVFVGSLRKDSINRKVVHALIELAQRNPAHAQIIRRLLHGCSLGEWRNRRREPVLRRREADASDRSRRLEGISAWLMNVRYWPKADIPVAPHISAFGGATDIAYFM